MAPFVNESNEGVIASLVLLKSTGKVVILLTMKMMVAMMMAIVIAIVVVTRV